MVYIFWVLFRNTPYSKSYNYWHIQFLKFFLSCLSCYFTLILLYTWCEEWTEYHFFPIWINSCSHTIYWTIDPQSHTHPMPYSASGSAFIFSWIPLWAHCSFLWSVCVSLFQYYVVLYAHIYQYCYFSGQSPSTPSQMHTLFLFLKSILIIPGPLPTHVSFGVRLLRSKINFWGIGWNCIEFGDSWHLWCWVLLYMNILYLSGSLGLL